MRARGWLATIILLLAAPLAQAQGGPPGPPQPLGTAPVPAGNPQTPAKIALGKVLFWEEQLSITGTVACGTCHRAFAGGADPRPALAGIDARHPGTDAIAGSADDVIGSPGVPAHSLDGSHRSLAPWGFAPQVGGRSAQSAVNAAYATTLFWDGRAGGEFRDPVDGSLLLATGGALENQALGPLVNSVEMSPEQADFAMIAPRLRDTVPLAVATAIPDALRDWIAGRDYPALFAEVFGTPDVTPARIALAIASYERTLASTQTPFDVENGGTPALTALERQGRQLFVANDCAACHAGALLSDDRFHYIGVRPPAEDLGRFAQTGLAADRGAMRTPSLRNVELRDTLMHNGRFATLEQVIDFYDRGGDFAAPNKDARVRPRGLTAEQKTALAAFLRRPLTDARVAAESAPFDRPTLYSEGASVPQIVGAGRAGSGGVPRAGALEPPLLGSRFTVTLAGARAGAPATLVVSRADPGLAAEVPTADFATRDFVVDAAGNASVDVALGHDRALLGTTLYGRFYVDDDAAEQGLAISPAFRLTVFGDSFVLFRDAFD